MTSRAQLRSACHLLLSLTVLQLQSARSAPAQSGDFVVGLATELGYTMTVLSPSGVTRSSIQFPNKAGPERNRATVGQAAISSDGKFAFSIGYFPDQVSVFVSQLKGSEPKLLQNLQINVTGCGSFVETLSIATGAILPGGDYEVYIGITCFDYCPNPILYSDYLSYSPQIIKYRCKQIPYLARYCNMQHIFACSPKPEPHLSLEAALTWYRPSSSAFVDKPVTVSSAKSPCSRSVPDSIPALQYLSGHLYYIIQNFNSDVPAAKLELNQVGNRQSQAVPISQLTNGCANQFYNGLLITSSTTFLGVCGDAASIVSVNGTAVSTAANPGRKAMRWVGTAATSPGSKYLYAIGGLFIDSGTVYTTNATVYRYDRYQLSKSPLPILQLDPSVTSDVSNKYEYLIQQLLVVP